MIPKYGVYKIIIYAGYKEEYFCFTTTEAANAIQTYLQYRERYGEKLTPDSYLFREQFNTADPFDCKNPKKMQLKGLSKLIAETAIRSGVMQKTSLSLEKGEKFGKKRNKVFRTHGFRKTVTTKMIEAGVNEFAVGKLLGHKSKGGVTPKHYYRPLEDELLQEFLKVVDLLTIDESQRLKRENEMLKVKKSEIEQLKEQVEEYKDFKLSIIPKMEEVQKQIAALNERSGGYFEGNLQSYKHEVERYKRLNLSYHHHD
jgi:hypothetical protein